MRSEHHADRLSDRPGNVDDYHPQPRRRRRVHRGTSTNIAPPSDLEPLHFYNAEHSPTAEAAEDRTPRFRRGGRADEDDRMRHGGDAEGELERRPRHDRRARGGRSGSSSSYSQGSKLTPPQRGGAGAGHEGADSA